LNYTAYDRLPIIHFGFWGETLQKWQREGHLSAEDLAEGGRTAALTKMGFDLEYDPCCFPHNGLMPGFDYRVVETLPDGSRKVMNGDGVIVLQREGATSIAAEIDHTLINRASWEEHFLPRLQFSEKRIPNLSAFMSNDYAEWRGLHCGSLLGTIRNWIGVTGLAYIHADDEELFREIIDTFADLQFRGTETILSCGTHFDYGHFWEDICYKNGPLVSPSVFSEMVGPHYRRVTELLKQYGITIVSLDCDGKIDALIPTWLHNGVNTMFPIEVGTWEATIQPWRVLYGKELRGVGGMNKNVFAEDHAAVDAEIERLRPLVDLGGFIPCPDHRLPPGAEWDNVLYYTECMRKIYG